MKHKPVLIVMRLADMHRVHPDQVLDKCCKCGETVAIYPSGQLIIEHTRITGGVDLVCHVCRDPNALLVPAPGSLDEVAESKRRDQ